MNPWHDVKVGDDAPNIVNAIIEIPKKSRAKYELDKETGLLKMDRVLFSSMHYPCNYGFIPSTYCDDKDPLDILVISHERIHPFCLLEAKVIGALEMIDGGEKDDKIIAVAANDVTVNHINDIDDLAPHFVKELRQFFESYKELEGKEVEIKELFDKKKAQAIVKESIELYNQTEF
jgi:inorganic pyrophosphatase